MHNYETITIEPAFHSFPLSWPIIYTVKDIYICIVYFLRMLFITPGTM